MQRVSGLVLSAVTVFFVLINFVMVPVALAQASATQSTSLQQLTQALIALSESANQSSAVDLAKQRYDLLLAVAAISPRQALQFMLPPGIAKQLPGSTAPYVETDADESGTLQVVVEDYARSHKLRFFLDTERERLEVYFAADSPPPLLSGSRIRGRGKRLGNVLLLKIDSAAALAAGTSGDVQVLSLSTTNTFGAQSTAVLLVNFFDDTSTPFTLSDLRSAVFTTVSNFDLENSQNQTWLTGDVFGWFTVPISVMTCPYLDAFTAAAQQAANAAGLNLSSYNRFVYVFPHNACFWEGEATIGGTPSQALINGFDKLEVIGHEMGHNLGLYHSHSWDCGGATLGTNCQTVEYGDLFDIMGNVTASHFNAFQKERLGWLNYEISQPITTVTTGGVYSVTPYESGAGVKALKVLRSTDSSTGLRTWYYIEYRQLMGFDAPLSVYPTASSVLIHSGAEGDPNSSLLLNTNPQNGFENAALGVGESFVDVIAGVTITTKSADASGASVDIEFGPGGCHVSAPLITVSPSQAPPVSAGSTQNFTVSITNQDTPGCNPASLFLLSTTPPPSTAGWTVLIPVSSLNLVPGTTATTTLQVTSPVAASAGFYQVGISAVKWPMYNYLASATATYVVSGAAVPDFAIAAPANASVQQGSSVAIAVTSTVSNGFSAPVSLSISGLPTGVTATFTPATFAAPGSGASTLTFNAARTVIAGSYALTITAFGGGITHLAPLTLVVTTAPPPPPPPPPPSNSYSLFSSTAMPDVFNANAGAALDVGMKFTADRNGYVTGIRFYKGTSNTGTHVASLWTSTGQLLAQATFTNETASGWQQVNFASPVAVTANTVYLVSYHSPSYYSYTLGTFNSPVDNPPLHAVLNSSSDNGVYAYGSNSTFPTTGAAGTNFWVDVVFTTATSTASLISIAVTPANPSIGMGSTQQFGATGTYSDNSTRDITGQVTWGSATPNVASITGAGLATGVALGSSVISATQGTTRGTTTLTVTSAPPPPPPPSNSYTLFSSTAMPDVLNANAGGALDVGMKFTADRNGYVAGIRFYKGTSNTGTHVASLWTSTGQLLAQATFTNETASGWQQVNFASPVAVTANTVYLVSYHSPSYYSYTLGTFNSPVDNPPLHAVLNSSSGNGVYTYGADSVFPTTGAAGANLWVDVVFQ